MLLQLQLIVQKIFKFVAVIALISRFAASEYASKALEVV
jgi:hypothetical protein